MVLQRSLVSLGIVLALASCGGNDSDHSTSDTENFTIPEVVTAANPTIAGEVSYSNVSVHDPSIIKDDDGTFYVFGTHLAYAKSTDLMHWEQLAPDGVTTSSLFTDSYAEQVPEGVAWVKNNIGSWAPDVKKLADGKYHFFFDHCSGSPDNKGGITACWRRSYLGVASADSITGPYTSDGIFIYSDQQAGEEDHLPDGATAPYDMNTNPNAIDPAVFNDTDGGLWMTYGSYSGGIFVLQLDPETGKPLPDQGFGTHVAGGNLAPVEGSYVIYSPETQYYYMFMSFAGFDNGGGYNMRVARSTSPNGPYLDAAGQDMVDAASTNLDILGNYGTKLMGSLLFDKQAGDAGTDHGYMSPGHNSAYYDADTGKYYVVFHTRFPGGGEGHQVRVHQMFMNEDGWLVASPTRYAAINGDNIVDEADVEGAYQFIDQQHDNNKTAHASEYIHLKRTWTNRGEIVGAHTGRYEMDNANHITLHFDDLGTYEGVLAWQYDDNTQALVPTFSALNGISSVMAMQLPVSDVTTALSNIQSALILPESTSTDLDIPLTGTQDASIVWASSNPDVISSTGKVTRPSGGEPDATVNLTATITLDGQTVTKQFTVTVVAHQQYDRVAQYSFENGLTDSIGTYAAGQYVGAHLEDAEGTATYAAGQQGQALALDGTYGIKLPDGLINSNEYTISYWMKANETMPSTTSFFGATDTDNWISVVPRNHWNGNLTLWSRNSIADFTGDTGQTTPITGQWVHIGVSVDHGFAKVYVNGVETSSGNGLPDLFTNTVGTFAIGANFWDPAFNGDIDELKIYNVALSAEEVRLLDVDNADNAALLQSAVGLVDLGDLSAVIEDLPLEHTGPYAANIVWQSSNPSIISNDGVVTRPTMSQGDQEVTLTATVSLNGITGSKTFTATVRSMGAPTPIAKYSFDNDDLADAQANFAAGSAVGTTPDIADGSVSYAAGVVGDALVLDGSNGVKLPNNLLDDDTYTVSLWLNPADLTKFTPAFFGYANGDSWVSIVPGGNETAAGKLMAWSGTAWYDAIATQALPLNTWSHVVLVNNGGQVSLYLNGQLEFSGANFPDAFGSGSITFALGVNFWDTPYQGMLDEVELFDNAITADDVQLLYAEGTNAD